MICVQKAQSIAKISHKWSGFQYILFFGDIASYIKLSITYAIDNLDPFSIKKKEKVFEKI
jgi:hypothetical protein